MHQKTLLSAARVTVPVLMGYLALGTAFGLLLAGAGYGPLWALFMSVAIYAGSLQILAVSLLAAQVPLMQVGLLSLALNLRHVVYGLSVLDKFRGMGLRKLYMIFSLTDETYALLTSVKAPEGVKEHDFFFAVAALNHSYWICGSVIGAALGTAIGQVPPGVDFAMTALFLVIAIGQWKGTRDHFPALLGLGATMACRLFFGADSGNNMILAALVIIVSALAFYKPRPAKHEPKEEVFS